MFNFLIPLVTLLFVLTAPVPKYGSVVKSVTPAVVMEKSTAREEAKTQENVVRGIVSQKKQEVADLKASGQLQEEDDNETVLPVPPANVPPSAPSFEGTPTTVSVTPSTGSVGGSSTNPGEPAACQVRPACLDSQPQCELPEPVGGWCQEEPSVPMPTPSVPVPAEPTPTEPSCQPRPPCFDSRPACIMVEPVGGWCPRSTIHPCDSDPTMDAVNTSPSSRPCRML